MGPSGALVGPEGGALVGPEGGARDMEMNFFCMKCRKITEISFDKIDLSEYDYRVDIKCRFCKNLISQIYEKKGRNIVLVIQGMKNNKVRRNQQILIEAIFDEIKLVEIARKWKISPPRVKEIICREIEKKNPELYAKLTEKIERPKIKDIRFYKDTIRI